MASEPDLYEGEVSVERVGYITDLLTRPGRRLSKEAA